MVYASWKHKQIAWFRFDSDPLVIRVTDVEIAVPFQYVSDLFVLVHVLVEEHFDLILVRRTHGAWRNSDLIAVGVVASLGEILKVGRRRRG